MSNNKDLEPGGAEKRTSNDAFGQNLHHPEDEIFCPEYAENLIEGDIRPYVLKDYKKEN